MRAFVGPPRAPLSVPLLYLAVASAFIAMYLPQPVLPLLAREFGVSAGAASLSISVLILAFAFASLLIGPLSDRLGRKSLLVLCTTLLAVPSLLCALAPSLAWLLLARFLQGALLPGMTAVTIAYITEEYPPEWIGTLLGGYIAATVSGGLLSRVISGSAAELMDWRVAFVVSASLSLLVGLLLALRLPPSSYFTPRGGLGSAFRGMTRHLRQPALVGGFLVGFWLFFAYLTVFTYLPFYLERPPFSFSPAAIGLVYLVYGAGIVSSPLAGWGARRLGRRRLMLLGFGLVALAQLGTLLPNPITLVLALLLLCFGNFAVQSAATAYIAAEARRDRGGANALYLFAYYIGGSLGAFVPGVMWTRYGWPGVLSLTLVSLLFGAVVVVTLCRPASSPLDATLSSTTE